MTTQQEEKMNVCNNRLNIDCKEYFDSKFEELEARIVLMNDANSKALEVADKDLQRRLEGMNEFRAQLTTQAANFITRDLHDRELELIKAKLDNNTKLLYIGLGIVTAIQVIAKFI